MQQQKISDIAALLNRMAAVTRGEKPTASQIFILAEMLAAEFEVDQVEIACKSYLAEGIFFPAYAELRSQLKNAGGEAWQSWHTILQHMKRHGYMTSPKLAPAAQRALEAVGGWMHLCEMESTQLNIVASQFVRAYQAMSQRERVDKLIEAGNDKPLLEVANNLFKFPR